MRYLMQAIIVCLLFFGVYHSSFAIDRTHQFGVGFDIAAIRLFGGEKGDSNLSGSGGLRLDYFLTNNFSLRYAGQYGMVKPRDGKSLFKNDPNLDFKTLLFSNTLELAYYPPFNKKIAPFVSGGGGLLVWDLRDSGESVYAGRNYNTIMSTNIGVDYPLTDYVMLTGFLGITHIFDQRADNIGTNDVNDRIFQVGLNLNFRFGGNRDTDGDGIYDRYDSDPLRAEDFDGFQDEDGIPDDDNDHDGVPDLLDKAPLVPEDKDGFQDDDGVPDPDNDWDGFADAVDGAPNDPEDIDGFQDDDGIPDLDNDGDGIPDITDKCKESSETYNGYRDDDGCPDEVPEFLFARGESIILQGVNFELNSAKLVKESKSVLDKVFESLFAYPEIEVEIRGYTDSTGGEEHNLKLSKERADTVRQYLIQKGIDSYRVIAKGFGSQDPIADNDSSTGRAKNRRIEFVRTD